MDLLQVSSGSARFILLDDILIQTVSLVGHWCSLSKTEVELSYLHKNQLEVAVSRREGFKVSK